jgi:hypothetical protein
VRLRQYRILTRSIQINSKRSYAANGAFQAAERHHRVRVAQAFVRNELDIFAAKRVPGAGREVPEGHSERAADFRFQLMHGASKAVGRQPFCKGRPPQGTRDRPSLGRLSERAARARCRDDDLSFCGIDWRVDHQLPGIGRTGMTSTDSPGKIVK